MTVALVLVGVTVPVMSRVVATPTPSRQAPEPGDDAARSILRLSVASFALPGLIFAATVLLGIFAREQLAYGPFLRNLLLLSFFLSLLLGPVTWTWGVIDAAGRRRLGWFTAILPTSLLAFLALVLLFIYSCFVLPTPLRNGSIPEPGGRDYNLLSALFSFLHNRIYANVPEDIVRVGGSVAIVGLIVSLYDAARSRRWGWSVALVVVLLMLLGAFATAVLLSSATFFEQNSVFADQDVIFIVPAAYTTTLLYALWASRQRLKAQRESSNGLGGMVVLAFISLLLLFRDHALTCSSVPYTPCFMTRGVTVSAAVGGGIAIVAGMLVVIDAVRHRRWNWFPALELIAVLTLYAWGLSLSYTQSNDVQLFVQLKPINYGTVLYHGIWLVLLTATLSYGLWSGTPTARRKIGARLSSFCAPVLMSAGIAIAVLTVELVWIAPPIRDNPQFDQITVAPARPLATFTLRSEIAGPNAFSDITTGPDGNLWFTKFDKDTIGRITPSGTIIEFPLPPLPANATVGRDIEGITAGPDGNLWFTEVEGNRIGRITPSGTITEFYLPNAGSTPLGITAGPDGNLWFTEFGGNAIGRITP